MGVDKAVCYHPYLFILAIETLAIAAHSHKVITGVTVGQEEHHIALFADDVIVFIKDLQSSISALLNLIKSFRNISEHKVNKDKSSLMLLNTKVGSKTDIVSQFKIFGTKSSVLPWRHS